MDICGDVFVSEVFKLSSFVVTNFDLVYHLPSDDLWKEAIHHRFLSSTVL